jgi:Mitochondrial carrier protein
MLAKSFIVFGSHSPSLLLFSGLYLTRLLGGQMGAQGSIQTVVAEILATGGPAGLYRGIGAASIRVLPMAISSFGTYELVRMLLSKQGKALQGRHADGQSPKGRRPRLKIRPIDD